MKSQDAKERRARRRRLGLAIACAVAVAACAGPQPSPRKHPGFERLPTRPEGLTSSVAMRGWSLYENFAAMNLAHAALRPIRPSSDPSREAVVTREPRGIVVRLVGGTGNNPTVPYEVVLSPHVRAPIPRRLDPPMPLAGDALAQLKAQRAALHEMLQTERCSEAALVTSIRSTSRTSSLMSSGPWTGQVYATSPNSYATRNARDARLGRSRADLGRSLPGRLVPTACLMKLFRS